MNLAALRTFCLAMLLAVPAWSSSAVAEDRSVDPELQAYVAEHFEAVLLMQEGAVATRAPRRHHVVQLFVRLRLDEHLRSAATRRVARNNPQRPLVVAVTAAGRG